MKKKHRKIIVDGVSYGWVVNKQDEDSSELGVAIYKNNKYWKSFWTDEYPITPKFISEKIKKYEEI